MKQVPKQWLLYIVCSMIIVLVCWWIGLFGIWISGISSIANNTNKFTHITGHVVEGEYSIDIDLSNLESALNKEIYNDGIHKIYVSYLNSTGNSDTGGFQIGFRSSGSYSLTGATLISGIHHETVKENAYKINMSAKMTAEYNGKLYESSEAWVSSLNYKDGDDFGFYIFPSHVYDSGEISIDEKGTVTLTLTNLYKNIWTKK